MTGPSPTTTQTYGFDPTYGMDLDALLSIKPPEPPSDFVTFWQTRYNYVRGFSPRIEITEHDRPVHGFNVADVAYESTRGATIHGWLLTPENGEVKRGMVVTHGYGGRDGPDFDIPVEEAALFFPCFRGLACSVQAPYSSDPAHHVLHDIDSRDKYILGGCVDDIWLAVTVLHNLFPTVRDHTGYCGISLGGGIGAIALPWDKRIQKAHFNVPTFGHQQLRLELETLGSGAAVQQYAKTHKSVTKLLQYYDAAIAARFVQQPVHIAAALADPYVAPPGQFAIYNALEGPKELTVLHAGHCDYPQRTEQTRDLIQTLSAFFTDL